MTTDSRTAAEVESRVLNYLHEELLPAGTRFDRETDLLSDEGLDSVSALRLALFVGQEFAVAIAPADFVVENFRSVAAIAEFVSRVRRDRVSDPPA
jgi:acyl carrier protein